MLRAAPRIGGAPPMLRIASAALVLIALAGAAYALHERPAAADRAAVTTVTPRRGDLEDAVSALGKIEPRDYVDVGAQVTGQLSRILVREGDVVREGDLLAEIDPRLQRAKLEVDRAQLDRLRAELAEQEVEVDFRARRFERQQKLRSAQLTAQEELDETEHDARAAAAKVDAIKAQLRELASALKADEVALGYTRIYAPMAGTVVSLDARQGQTLNANQQAPIILRIADLSSVTVWTQVSEADVPRLRSGMDVYCTTLGHGARRWTGTLRQVLPAPPRPAAQAAPAATVAGGGHVVLYTALFDLDNREGELKPGMSAQVFFVVARARDALLLPTALLQDRRADGTARVDVVDRAGRVVQARVRTGLRTRVSTEIVGGLDGGARVVSGRAPEAPSWFGTLW
jgi:macrolide-specific efflux system membrane fusion protein